jgi:hypothetical protein
MFPSNVNRAISTYIKSDHYQKRLLTNFPLVADDLSVIRNKFIPIQLQECHERIQNLVESHKIHYDSLKKDFIEERQSPWFMNVEASEIVIKCFQLRVEEIGDKEFIADNEINSLNQLSDFVLKINRFLYGPSFMYNIVSSIVN